MTQPVYSVRFAIGVATTSLTVVYLVPQGKTAVLRDIELFAPGSVADHVDFEAIGPGGGRTILFLAAGQGVSAQWRGNLVIPEDEELALASVNGGTHFTISGFLLTSS